MSRQYLKVNLNTLVKTRPENSASIPSDQMVPIPSGTVLPVAAYARIAGHYKVTLGKVDGQQVTYLNRNTVYFWAGHVEIFDGDNSTKALVLAVPFFPQTDNYVQPDRTCNSGSHAMVVSYLLPSKLKDDNTYLRQVMAIGDTTDHNVHSRLLMEYGIQSYWETGLDFDDLDAQLEQGYPVVIGILHRGSLANPTGGHICVVRGQDDGGYVVNDPYGSLLDGYTSNVGNGRGVVYSKELLNARWLVYERNSGWGRVIKHVEGR